MMHALKARDLWRIMHERNLALALPTVKPTTPTVAKAAPPDPCADCRNHKADTCGGVKLSGMTHAERAGCTMRYW
jgi:hypothetical protein